MTNGGKSIRALAPYAVVAGLLAISVAGRLAEKADQQARLGRPVAMFVPVLDEFSSAIVWLAVFPVIAWAFRRIVPSRLPWTAILLAYAVLIPLVSLTHFTLTRVLRAVVYALEGDGFRMYFSWGDYAADLYTDILTVLLLGLIYRGAERLLVPHLNGDAERTLPQPGPGVIEVRDGAQTIYVPITEIRWAEAAGNYVELHRARGAPLLMRTTLAQIEERLRTDGFLRIHRSRLVNAAAVTAVENLPSGDAALLLVDGTRLSASRRYRASLSEGLAARARGAA